jgi:glycosyl hydrolase family 12
MRGACLLSLLLASSAVLGCAEKRVTAVELIPSANGADAAPDAQPDATANSASSCIDPVFVSSSADGIWNNDGYFVFNDIWNTPAGPGPQTLYACSYHDFYVVSEQSDDGGNAVKSYPNVQMNYNDLPLSSFHHITSRFAETGAHVGRYEYAFDVWLNGVAQPNSSQIMVWVENHDQTPLGTQGGTTTFGGRSYDIWNTSDNLHLTLVATETLSSGQLDLLEIFKWAITQGYTPVAPTLGQIDFGVELVSTGGSSATYRVDDFTLATD